MAHELQTERLTLRSLRPSDAGLMTLYASDERVARMTAVIPHPYPPGTAEAFIEAVLGGRHAEEVWATDATQIGSSELVGVISFNPVKRMIGYWVGPAFWNTGMASEAVEALVRHLFDDRDVPDLVASVFVDNPASQQVLRKLGFAMSREHDAFSVARGELVATLDFTLSAGAFSRAQSSAATA